jgi:hypothetical protein
MGILQNRKPDKLFERFRLERPNPNGNQTLMMLLRRPDWKGVAGLERGTLIANPEPDELSEKTRGGVVASPYVTVSFVNSQTVSPRVLTNKLAV